MLRNQLLELLPLGPADNAGISNDPYGSIPDHRRYNPIGAAIGIGGSLLGGFLGSSAAKKASAAQLASQQRVEQMDEQATQGAQAGMGQAVGIANQGLAQTGLQGSNLYGNVTNNLNPYLNAGTQGVNTLAGMMAPGGQLTQQFSFDPSQVANTPEYKFALDQGTQAVNQSQAARGLLNSGSTLKGLMSFGQGLASQQYQNAYNNSFNTFQTNRNNTLQGLGMLTGIGQNATGQFNQATQNFMGQNLSLAQMMSGNTMGAAQYGGNVGMQGAQQAGQAIMGGANAQAAGIMGQANAWSGALSGMGNSAMGLGQMYNLGQMGGYGGGGGGYGMPGVGGQPGIDMGGGSGWYSPGR